MRGFPLMNLLILAGLLALLVVPLARVNTPGVKPAVEMSGPADAVAVVPVRVVLRFVHAPQEVAIAVEGKPLALRGNGLERTAEAQLPMGDGALEFSLKATWEALPGAGPGMMEVKVAPDGREEQMQNVWSDQAGAPVEEVVRFTWRKRS